MKKTVMFISMSIAGLFSLAQTDVPSVDLPIDPDSRLIQYREVVNQEGTKDVLYDRGASWFSSYYKSPASVLKIQDKVNGKLEGLGRFTISYTNDQGVKRDAGIINYVIRLELKDDKFRYTLTEFNLKANSKFPIEKWMNKNDPAYNLQWDSYLFQVDTTMQGLVRNLKEGMKPKVIKKDEW